MISDVFYTRYPEVYYHFDNVSDSIEVFFVQVGKIIFEDICPSLGVSLDLFKKVQSKLSREIGLGILGPGKTDDEICGRLLFERYDLWNDRHGTSDYFIKVRLSLIELIFRELEDLVNSLSDKRAASLFRVGSSVREGECRKVIEDSVVELNSRFKVSGLPLSYHNGYIQFANDDAASLIAEEGFWNILRGLEWKNVDMDIKEALDRRDHNKSDAAFYAFKALESTVKIVSDKMGVTTGKEKGAANYIDNLVSKKNGRLIEPWEGDVLKILFSNIRNPHGHGAGSAPAPELKPYQVDHAIETVMSWIKSLVKRV